MDGVKNIVIYPYSFLSLFPTLPLFPTLSYPYSPHYTILSLFLTPPLITHYSTPLLMKSGFYISCKKGREDKAFKEVSSVLLNLLTSSKKYSKYEEIKIEEEIEKERAERRSPPFKIFFKYSSMLFVSNASGLPSTTFYSLLREKNVLFSYALRVVPFDSFFKLEDERLREAVGGLDSDKSFKIVYEERFVPGDTREKVFGGIIAFLQMRVDLTTPFYFVVVQALKTSVGISIIKNEGKKFNNFNFSRESR